MVSDIKKKKKNKQEKAFFDSRFEGLEIAIMTLSIGTDRHGQTVQTRSDAPKHDI